MTALGVLSVVNAGAMPVRGQPDPGAPPPPAAVGQPAITGVQPLPAAGEAMTLDQAIDFAMKNNPRIGGAAEAVREARARITQAKAVRLPQLGVNNFVFRQGPIVPSGTPGGPLAVPPWRYNVGVFLNQVIWDFGQRAALQRQAQRETNAADSLLAETRNNVTLVVSTAFFNIHRAQQLLGVAQQLVASTTEQLRVARARYQADVAPRFDVLSAETDLAAAEQAAIEAQNDVRLSEATFNNALGRDVTAPVRLAYQPNLNQPDVPFEGARDTALRARPQLEAQRQTVEAERQRVRARRAEDKPQIGFSGTYDRPNTGGFASQPYRYGIGLVMTWPFFDSGLTRGRVHEAEAAMRGQRQVLEQQRQQVELEVRQAQLDIQEARQRIQTSEKQLTSAREALRVAQVRYQAGVGTTVEVTVAQVAAARAGENLANSQFDFETAVARLENATGTPVERLAPR